MYFYSRHVLLVTVFLSSFQDWLYWTDEITKSVYKINHAVHADQSDIVYEVMHNLSSPHDIDIYHSLKQPQGNACHFSCLLLYRILKHCCQFLAPLCNQRHISLAVCWQLSLTMVDAEREELGCCQSTKLTVPAIVDS